jgi:putative endonuclease
VTKRKTDGTGKPDLARQKLGRLGERLAANALEERGYAILERNFRCRSGEIDLVAQEAEDLVFVEVKARRGIAYGLPEEAVTERKARQIQTVALSYLELHNLPDCSWRIDVVAVQFSSFGKLEEIRVYQHAITAS